MHSFFTRSHKKSAHCLVIQVPFIIRVTTSSKVSLGQGNMKLDRSDKMTFETLGQAKYPWSAEIMADYMRKTWGLDIAEIDRPSESCWAATRGVVLARTASSKTVRLHAQCDGHSPHKVDQQEELG
jgi:hypothetical protein